MKTLQDTLIEKTQDLKELYIDKSIEFAEKEFDALMRKRDWSYEVWVANYSVKTIVGTVLKDRSPGKRSSIYHT
jgi:CRISPR/Cas system-associated protein Cas10 (large subunit of type III CRISPR-Cas system)